MGALLDDITIYYDGTVLSGGVNSEFRGCVNYICDFYHKMLFGYKPPKTGRINIMLGKEKMWEDPWYNGSICHISNVIDEDHYLSLSKKDRHKYILELVHKSILELVSLYKWDKTVFENAYVEICKKELNFSLLYPTKKSKDRKLSGQVLIEKSELITSLFVIITGEHFEKKVKLFDKKNWWWWDSAYALAKNSGWLDNNSFGVRLKGDFRYGYYSIANDEVTSNLNFKENEF